MALTLSACSKPQEGLHGYIEAEPVRVAAPLSGRMLSLAVARGEHVVVGQELFVLEQESERAAVNEAKAKLAQAHAQAADLESGKRADELAVIQAQLKAASATAKQAESDLMRQSELVRRGFASAATLDALKARRDASVAEVSQLNAQLRVAKLKGRKDERQALNAAALAAQAQLVQKQWALAQKRVDSPVAARVEDRYFLPGEWVAAGTPVLSLLAADGLKARFWVPEPLLAKLKVGQRLKLSCDGCGAPIAATISFIAREAEFTPPVIYSKENRAKLVFMVEARPAASHAGRLHPGQPVDVVLQ